jgi:AraC-like DNA-binding protein
LPDLKNRHRLLWQSHRHFDLAAPWEHVEFVVYAAFDVVTRPGWRFIASPQVFHELWLVRDGCVEIEQNGRVARAQAQPGVPRVVLIRAGESRDTRQSGAIPLSIAGFSFAATVWGALDFLAPQLLPPVLTSSPRLVTLMTDLVEEAEAHRDGYALAVHGLGQLALVEMLRMCQAETKDDGLTDMPIERRGLQNRELVGALELVRERFSDTLSVEQMAHAAHLSPKYFGRKFHASFGLTPMDYLRRVRLNRARELLATSDASVAQIAERCGFSGAAHFSRSFKRHFGLAPLALRHEARRKLRP